MVAETATTSVAKARLQKILEEEKKQEREAKLAEIKRKQKEELKKQLGEEDSDDDDFDDDSEEEQKNGAKPKPVKTSATKKSGDPLNYFMKKAGKEIEESSEISMEEEEADQIPVVAETPAAPVRAAPVTMTTKKTE